MVTLDAAQPVSPAFRAAISARLGDFIASRREQLVEIGPEASVLADRSLTFTGGGKRLRPAFCAWGYAAASGSLDLPDGVLSVAASLDLLHVSALVHDDVMDASDSRRGVPAAHRQFEADHRARGGRGHAEAFGRAGAILLGDLLLVWSEELLRHGLDALGGDVAARVRPFVEAVRTEVTTGQYLDVLAQSLDPHPLTRTPAGVAELTALIERVVTFKSACYTVQRPLDIGAALVGDVPAAHALFEAFGRPLGRAFQYRDDVLGVFGDEALTGKDSGEDLREGKLTLLAVKAFADASPDAAAEFASLFGSPTLGGTELVRARQIVTDAGAAAHVEGAIAEQHQAALNALDAASWLPGPVRSGLAALADAAVRRDF